VAFGLGLVSHPCH